MSEAQHGLLRRNPSCLPERRLHQLTKHPNLFFHPRVELSKKSYKIPSIPKTTAELKEIKYHEAKIGLAALSSLIHQEKWSNPDLSIYSGQVRDMLISGMQSYDLAIQLILKHQPDLHYVFNGRFVNTRSFLDAALETKTNYLIHERGASMNLYSVRPYMPHDFKRVQSDLLLSWKLACNENPSRATQIANSFFHDRRAGLDQGWFSFTSKQVHNDLPSISNSCAKIVTFFTSSDDEYKAVGDIVKWERWKDQHECLKDIIEICTQTDNIHLLIRVHPHMEHKHPSDLAQLLRLIGNHPRLTVILPESSVDTYALIESSDLVITAMSTVGIESVYWGTPSACMGPSLYDSIDAVLLPTDKGELFSLVNNIDNLTVDPEKALAYGYYMNTFGKEFLYYRASSLRSGSFKGVDVQTQPPPRYIRALKKVYRLIKS